jgi:rod shape-determining protein MreD
MALAQHRGGAIILVTLVAGLLLTLMPLPEWARPFRPQWYTLVLIYWVMAVPERVGVGSAWLLGILVDVLTGTVLGQHALGLSVIAFLLLKVHRQVRLFPLWQQSLAIFSLLLLERVLALWIIGATHQPLPDYRYWAAPAIGMLLWPWAFIVLRDLRRRFRVT